MPDQESSDGELPALFVPPEDNDEQGNSLVQFGRRILRLVRGDDPPVLSICHPEVSPPLRRPPTAPGGDGLMRGQLIINRQAGESEDHYLRCADRQRAGQQAREDLRVVFAPEQTDDETATILFPGR